CPQNEYSQWAHDPHADAYRMLFNERSQSIAKRLGSDKKAHEDRRCLACHVNPLLAKLPLEDAHVREEMQFGVSCESCHGAANAWLVAHTRADWRSNKCLYAMPDLTDPAIVA